MASLVVDWHTFAQRQWLREHVRAVMRGGSGKKGAISATSSTQCTACHHGELTPTRLTITLTYGGKSCSVDDDDALVRNACGDELIGERAAVLLTQRALAPDVARTATVTRRTESV